MSLYRIQLKHLNAYGGRNKKRIFFILSSSPNIRYSHFTLKHRLVERQRLVPLTDGSLPCPSPMFLSAELLPERQMFFLQIAPCVRAPDKGQSWLSEDAPTSILVLQRARYLCVGSGWD